MCFHLGTGHIGESFAECVGAMLSSRCADVTLTISPRGGAIVREVRTAYRVTRDTATTWPVQPHPV